MCIEQTHQNRQRAVKEEEPVSVIILKPSNALEGRPLKLKVTKMLDMACRSTSAYRTALLNLFTSHGGFTQDHTSSFVFIYSTLLDRRGREDAKND